MPALSQRFNPSKLAGLFLVLALHAAGLYGLWSLRLMPAPEEAVTLFVNFISPPAPEKAKEPTRPPAKPHPIEKQQPRQLVAETPVVAATDRVAPPPLPSPPAPIEAPPMPLPAGPVALSSELSVACPERSAPAYPIQSRRLGETGLVVLRVELSETGHVAQARVHNSSGYARLDEVALATVRTWRCTPTTRNGQPVRAVALQPFNFTLQGN